jgi:uncharacterized RDD family membrane protein YckC
MALALGAVLSSAAPAQQQILSGGEKALWLIRCNSEGKSFDLVVRPEGGRWQWVGKELGGEVAAAQASADNLHVAFRSGEYFIYAIPPADGIPGLRLPVGPVAMCYGKNFGPSTVPALVAIAPRSPLSMRADTMATTQATTASAPTQPAHALKPPLDVIQYVGEKWEHLTTLTGVPSESYAKLHVAIVDSALYVLVGGPENRLMAWKEDKWRDLPLSDSLAKATVVGMTAMEDKLAIVSARPTGSGQEVRLAISVFSAAAGMLPEQSVARDAKAARWPAGSIVAASRLADKLAILWRDGNALKLATCSPATGQLDPTEDVAILNQPPSDQLSLQVQGYFMGAVLLLTLLILFMVKPQSVPKPFSLPANMLPGPLLRRMLAMIIDLFPFLLACSLVMTFVLPMTPEELSALLTDVFNKQRDYPLAMVLSTIGMMCAYLVYCIIMEKRLGATLGKKLMGLRVVGDDGQAPGLREVSLRNLLKVMELAWIPLMVLVPLLTRYRQRLGDIIARSAVVDARTGQAPQNKPPAGEDDDRNAPPWQQ